MKIIVSIIEYLLNFYSCYVMCTFMLFSMFNDFPMFYYNNRLDLAVMPFTSGQLIVDVVVVPVVVVDVKTS